MKAAFKSKRELQQILERVLEDLDADPEVGPKLRAAGFQQRLEITDAKLVLNIASGRKAGECLRWKFSDDVDWEPLLTLRMNSEVANRYFQGKESVPVAIVHRRIQTSCGDPRVVLRNLPANGRIFERYRKLVEAEYPHLAV
jgi:hypothetical protein